MIRPYKTLHLTLHAAFLRSLRLHLIFFLKLCAKPTAIEMYIPIAMCLLCMAVVIKAESFPNDDRSGFLIMSTMGTTVKLPGYLETPGQPFYKDNQAVYASEHIYDLTVTAVGYQVNIHFLTCTDEGAYRVGRETSHLRVKAEPRGVFYYTARVDKNKGAAFISPLDGVISISMLYVFNRRIWSPTEVWNNNMSRLLIPAPCCSTTDGGNTFVGNGDKQVQYYVYQRHGQAGKSCSDIQPAGSAGPTTTTRKPLFVLPGLKTLEDLPKTPVKLHNVTGDIQNLKRMLEDFKRSWKSEGSTLQFSVMLPLFMTTLVFNM